MRNDELERVFLSSRNVKEKKTHNNKKQNKMKEPKDEDVVKLSLLYFLEHVFFGKERKNLLDMQWIALIDNSEAFNKYSWRKSVMRGHYWLKNSFRELGIQIQR